MKRRIFITVLLFSILLAGCSDSGDNAMADAWDNDSYEDDNDSYEDDDDSYEDENEYEAIYEEMVVASYPFIEIRPFCEERAWVDFQKDGYGISGVIDTDGKLIYQAESQLYYVSQFQDGLAFYRTDSTEESPCGIIDSDGNVLFESQITPEGGYLILAYGNGHFFVAQHIQNFDTNEWRYGTIDKDGNILNEMEPYDEISYSDFFSDYWSDEAIRYIDQNFIRILFKENENPFGPSYSEGLRFDVIYDDDDDVPGYYDKDSSLVISLMQYAENDITGGAFHGGYAAIIMIGADDEYYASVIDKQGNLAYSPVKIDEDGTDPDNSANGYLQAIIDGEKKIIGPDGTVYTPEADNLSMLEGLTFGDVSNGYILMGISESYSSGGDLHYASLDGSTIIDSAKMTSTSAEISDEESWEDEYEEDFEDDITSYIVPDSFDIIGKWKSVGDDGFGQAQPGAIVIFDGSRCNFFSPSDTYAFYKDGDRYVLDITGALGGSMSQTVNIIDENNIEVAGASLRRIE